jgi:hypothetical protein
MTPQRRVLFSRLVVTLSMLINSFRARVLGDAGTFEGEANLLNQNFNTIKDASFVFVPSAYKSGKAYAIKPTDGSGDLTFTRGSFGYRNNGSNLIEFVSSGIPRLDNVSGILTLLGEPIRTQLVTNSADLTNASWSKVRLTAANTSNTTPLKDITARKLTVNAVGAVRCQIVTITGLTAGTRYAFRQYIKKDNVDVVSCLICDSGEAIAGTIIYNFATNTFDGTANGIGYIVNKSSTLLTDGWVAINIVVVIPSGQTTLRVNSFMPAPAVSGINIGDSLFVSNCQLEVGQFSTTDIVTGNSTLTRVGDSFVNNNASNFASEGTLFICFRNNRAYNNEGTHTSGFYLSNGVRGIYFANTTTGRIRIWTESATTVFQTTADTCKIAVTFNGSVLNVWQNGIKVVTNFAFPYTFNQFGSQSPNVPTYIENIFLFKEIKDDSYCATLTI